MLVYFCYYKTKIFEFLLEKKLNLLTKTSEYSNLSFIMKYRLEILLDILNICFSQTEEFIGQ